MNSLANAIASQDPITVTGSWQRHLPARYRDRALEGHSAYTRWGRDPGFPILRFGRPTSSVVVHAYRRLVDSLDDPSIREQLAPRLLVTAEIKVTEILDLRTARARMELGLSLAQLAISR